MTADEALANVAKMRRPQGWAAPHAAMVETAYALADEVARLRAEAVARGKLGEGWRDHGG